MPGTNTIAEEEKEMAKTMRYVRMVASIAVIANVSSPFVRSVHCALYPGVPAEAHTLIQGVKNREVLIQTLTVQWLTDVHLSVNDRSTFSTPPEPPRTTGIAVSHHPPAPQSAWSTEWSRVFAADGQCREETVALQRQGSSPYRTKGLQRGAFVEELPSRGGADDFPRRIVIDDGERHISYNNLSKIMTVRWQEWSGPATAAPVLRATLMFGTEHRTFGDKLQRALSVADRVTVKKSQRDNGVEEYHLRIHNETSGRDGQTAVDDYDLYIVPAWGYAVRRYEEKRTIQPGPTWGRGEIYVGEDWKEIGREIWLPHNITVQRFEYGGPGSDPLKYTRRTRVLKAAANVEAEHGLFRFAPPLGARIYDRTGTVADAESTRAHFDAALDWAEESPAVGAQVDLVLNGPNGGGYGE